MNQTKKFCPECQKEGKKSTVHCVSKEQILIFYEPYYYDENGQLTRNEDQTIMDPHYYCSNGHTWTEKL